MKNKLIAFLSVGFALFFVIFVFRVTDNMSNSKKLIENSVNVSDVTNLISTHLLVTEANMPIDGDWTKSNFNDQDWSKIQIPSYQIVQDKKFKEGNYAYYRIKLPKIAFEKLSSLQDESSLALSVIFFNRLDIVLNGSLHKTNKPSNSSEANVIVPVKEGQDNIICLKAYIATGDTGIDHRDKILLGKGAELNALYGADYKTQTAFQLVFILCKGSILFIFALIFLLLKVETSFEKFFIFGVCAVIEELIAGEYFYGPLNFNQMVYLYNFVNVGAASAVFLFLAELLKSAYSKKLVLVLFILLLVVSTLLVMDALYLNYMFDLTTFMRFWNLMTVSILIYYLPRVIKSDRILFVGLLISVVLYIWGTLPTNNIGLNYKAYGNLLLFIMVAYQTFSLFRHEKIQLQKNERKLLEQEKDVAIGKTASLLAHDIRKPLEQMKLVMDKMLSGDADKQFLDIAKKDIDISISCVDRQVNDIMNFSRINKVELNEISFYKTLAHSINQVMSIHQEMDLELVYNFGSNMKILGEPSRLSGVLVNLISNAVEAIRDIGNKYKGKIEFSTFSNESFFFVKIFNDGPEIPFEIIGDIFKPLFTHGKASGTGLGLASVFKAIDEHQGFIDVKNLKNRGVEFNLKFHIGKQTDDHAIYGFRNTSISYSQKEINQSVINETLNLRVLILENDSISIENYKIILNELPYNVSLEIANDVNRAKELVEKLRFDLYLLNYEINGLDLYRKHLYFLKSEVILYSRLSKLKPEELSCKLFSNNLSLENLIETCSSIYPKRTKVLFVDDTKLFRAAWQMFHGDHNIKCVSSPEEALLLLSITDNKYDAYVLDYHYSNSSLNGEFLARRILALQEDASVFIASSLDQEIDGVKSISKRDYEIRSIISTQKT